MSRADISVHSTACADTMMGHGRTFKRITREQAEAMHTVGKQVWWHTADRPDVLYKVGPMGLRVLAYTHDVDTFWVEQD